MEPPHPRRPFHPECSTEAKKKNKQKKPEQSFETSKLDKIHSDSFPNLVTPARDVFTLHCGAHCIRDVNQEDPRAGAYTTDVQLLLNLKKRTDVDINVLKKKVWIRLIGPHPVLITGWSDYKHAPFITI